MFPSTASELHITIKLLVRLSSRRRSGSTNQFHDTDRVFLLEVTPR